MNLTHLDENNNPKMVDISDKNITNREAVASGIISVNEETFYNFLNSRNKKGSIFQTSIIAAINGAKETSRLIPMAHNILLTSIKVNIEDDKNLNQFKVIVFVKNKGQTGVEMEALTGVSIALLTIYDMLKSTDKGMIIKNIQLEEKKGGKSGNFNR